MKWEHENVKLVQNHSEETIQKKLIFCCDEATKNQLKAINRKAFSASPARPAFLGHERSLVNVEAFNFFARNFFSHFLRQIFPKVWGREQKIILRCFCRVGLTYLFRVARGYLLYFAVHE